MGKEETEQPQQDLGWDVLSQPGDGDSDSSGSDRSVWPSSADPQPAAPASGTPAEQPSPCANAAFESGSQEEESVSPVADQTETGEPSSAVAADTPAEIVARLERLENITARLGQSITRLVEQHDILQAGLRQLGNQVTDAASSLAAPRIRELYLRLVLMYDVIEPPPAGISEESASLCRAMADQIEQFLAASGIRRIETDGKVFDATLHRPVQVVPRDDPALDNLILATRRNGFQAEYDILRPAEVVIARLAEEPSASKETDSQVSPAVSEERGGPSNSTPSPGEEG